MDYEKMASFLSNMASTTNLLSAYASISTCFMLLRTIFSQFIPKTFQDYITSKITNHFFSRHFTFIIEEEPLNPNITFEAAQVYLPTKVGPNQSTETKTLLVRAPCGSDHRAPEVAIPVGAKVLDKFEGMTLTWTLESRVELENRSKTIYFKLKCKKNCRERVLKTYFPHVITTARAIEDTKKGLKIFTYNMVFNRWQYSEFSHPATFETLAMEPELKKSIVEDLDSFVRRKEFFQSVGRAWKRGYLLYGPPGTGKSTLVAAVANHLRYNIYDLQFASVKSDFELRHVLTSTTNRSILLVEDIDCSLKASYDRCRKERDFGDGEGKKKNPLDKSNVTLAGLLNFIDGLWSSCGQERIIIFTTNHKDKLDPALLRPGRMDVHIYMGHCTPAAFKMLASMYLMVKQHTLYKCIEELIRTVKVTPAEVAQQLMKTERAEVALMGLVEFLRGKKEMEEKNGSNVNEDDEEKEDREGNEKEEDEAAKKGRKRGQDDGGSSRENSSRCVYLT